MISPKIAALTLIIALLIPVSYAIGIAMPPSKHFDALIGDEFYIDIMILNQEGVTGNYSISFDGLLGGRTTANPPTVVIYPPLDVLHRGNPAQDGFENCRIYVNSTGLTPGTYDLRISTSVSKEGSGALNLIQKVTRSIDITYQYPPSFVNKAANFIYAGAKNAYRWFISLITRFYENNKWLNYLFFLIILTIVFYIGAQATEIARYLGKVKKRIDKEVERMKKYGFWTWLLRKIKDIFKKKEKQDLFKENGKKGGPNNGSEN